MLQLLSQGIWPIAIEKLQPHFLRCLCFICLYFNGLPVLISNVIVFSPEISVFTTTKGGSYIGQRFLYLTAQVAFPSAKCFSIVLPPSEPVSPEDAASRLNRLRDVL